MNRKLLVLSSSLVLLSGCLTTVGPDYEGAPEVSLPKAWNHQLGKAPQQVENNLSVWWNNLNDPTLNDIIDKATGANLDLRVASSRIREAEAQYGVAASGKYPSIDAAGSATRESSSENLTNAPSRTEDYESIGAGLNWELDLFGRVERQIEAAEASVEAAEESYRDVLVVLYAEIARTYVQVRTLQKRLDITYKNIENQKETLKIVKARYAAELTSESDVFRAEQNLASTESAIPPLNAALNRSINRLSVFIGENPGSLHKELMIKKPIPTINEDVAVSLPRDVLRQRPDIRLAERQLAAQTARIGVATADLYPRLSLGGVFGFGAGSGSLLSSASNFWSFGPNFTWNVFDGGRTRSQIKVEDERAEQARATYEKSVLEAFEDVENALVDYTEEKNRLIYINKSVQSAQKSVSIAKSQYKNGLTNFQTVLDAERVLFAEQDRLADSQGALVNYLVGIYRSMGGGWDSSQVIESAAKETTNKKIPN